MLVDEHADGDAAGVEAIQEVLDVVVSDGVVLAKGVFVLDDSLSHGGDDLIMPVPDGLQYLHKPEGGGETTGGNVTGGEEEGGGQLKKKKVKAVLSCPAPSCPFLYSRLEDTVVVRVLVQKLKELHEAVVVPERTQTQESSWVSGQFQPLGIVVATAW